MSEAALARDILAPFCEGLGLDVGFGGSALVPHALTFDMPRPYTSVGQDKQILKGDCRDLSMFCDESLDWIASNHLLEDFPYQDLIRLIVEWRRVLKAGGLLITNCPDQQKFLRHIGRTGQPDNLAHYEQDFSLQSFKDKVISNTGMWETIFEQPEFGPYSWLLVLRKT